MICEPPVGEPMQAKNLDFRWRKSLRSSCHRLTLMTLLFAAGTAWAGSVTPTDRVTRYVVVRKDHSAASAPVGQLKPAETAETIESAGRWFKIRLSTGSEGYVS